MVAGQDTFSFKMAKAVISCVGLLYTKLQTSINVGINQKESSSHPYIDYRWEIASWKEIVLLKGDNFCT